MKMRITLLLLLGVLLPPANSLAQKLENCLLWRISGNGMAKPSYLYGTYHIRARKVFNFPDSLYTAIDNTEYFALEVNPDSMSNGMSDYVGQSIDNKAAAKGKKKEKQLRDILTKDELKTLRNNLPEGSGINPEELTVKQVYALKDRLTKTTKRKDDMATFMDAFLYTIAKDKGRVITGLEHMEDQIKLLESTDFGDVDPAKIMEVFNMKESLEKQMTDLYIDQDMEQFQKISEMFSEKAEKAILSNRNKNMLRSMDSIMKHHSLFSAVGTLHLPGNQGLINLLRQKGFTVEPVFCESRTNGADYEFKKTEASWVNYVSEKDGYSIKMPGNPGDVDAYGGTVKMKMYMDVGTSRCFMVCHVPRPPGSAVTTESVIAAMAKEMIKVPRDYESKSISVESLKGKEYFFSDKDANHYHMQLLGNDADIYMIIAYSTSWNIRNVDSFFNSFKLIPKVVSKKQVKSFEDIHLSARLPDYKPTRAVTYYEDSSQKQTMYTIVDPAIGIYYFVVGNETTPGYNYSTDSIWLNTVKEKLSGYGATVTSEKGKLNAYKTERFESTEFQGQIIKGMLVFCGNRIYKVMAQAPNNDQCKSLIDSFLSSVEIDPVQTTGYTIQTSPDGKFSTMAPAPFKTDIKDTTSEADTIVSKESSFNAHDERNLINFFIVEKKLNYYYWNSNDTQTLSNWISRNKGTNETEISHRYYTLNGNPAGEYLAKKNNSSQLHRIKALANGRTRFILDCTYPVWLAESKDVDAFYSSFKVLEKNQPTLRTNPEPLMKALASNDTNVRDAAQNSINDVFVSESDVPYFIAQLGKVFPDDTGNEHTTADYLLNGLAANPASISIEQVERLYKNENVKKRVQQFGVLELLTRLPDSEAAFKKLKELLLNAPPVDGSSYSLAHAIKKHGKLATILYPEVLQLAGDSCSGPMVSNVATFLLDSGLLQKDPLLPRVDDLVAKCEAVRKSNRAYIAREIMYLLTSLSTPAAWKEVRACQFDSHSFLRYAAITMLCDSNKFPDKGPLDSLAADDLYRVDLYQLLQHHAMARFYPEQYKTQEYFAVSYISNDEDFSEIESFELLGMKKATYNNDKRSFYLFDVKSKNAGDPHYLGIAGPFSDDTRKLTIDAGNNLTGFYFKEPIDKSKLETQLKLYLINKKIDAADEN